MTFSHKALASFAVHSPPDTRHRVMAKTAMEVGDLPLTPLDIHNKEFKRSAFGGYNRDEVDEFLDLIIQEFEKNLREIASLQEQVKASEERLEQYRALEDTLQRTLVVAQETADGLRSNARREADLIIQDARMQAHRVIEAGENKARRITEKYEDVDRATVALKVQLRSILNAHLDLLEQFPPPEAIPAVPAVLRAVLAEAAATAEVVAAPDAEPAAGVAADPEEGTAESTAALDPWGRPGGTEG